jgi:DNA invertase Pin-like site-specific DNA recombinase
MKLNQNKVIELFNDTCGGSYTDLARLLSVDKGHVHRYLKKGIGGGEKICTTIMKYCQDRGLNVYEYFILD